ALMAQTLPTLAPQPGQEQPSEPEQPATTLKVNVEVVQLFFNVKDKRGGLIPNLTKDDLQGLEDGKPQTIKYFTPETNLPFKLGILIDSSANQQNVLQVGEEEGGAFLQPVPR